MFVSIINNHNYIEKQEKWEVEFLIDLQNIWKIISGTVADGKGMRGVHLAPLPPGRSAAEKQREAFPGY